MNFQKVSKWGWGVASNPKFLLQIFLLELAKMDNDFWGKMGDNLKKKILSNFTCHCNNIDIDATVVFHS